MHGHNCVVGVIKVSFGVWLPACYFHRARWTTMVRLVAPLATFAVIFATRITAVAMYVVRKMP